MERHYGMDWLRIGAFALLIFYHIGMVFVPWDFHIKTAQPMDWVEIPMLLTNPWRLTLLFVVSGYASRALLSKSTGISGFLKNRTSRLLIPLIFGMAVIVPPQTWVELVGKHGYGQSYFWFLAHDYFRFGKLDGVVNNAAISREQLLVSMSTTDWDAVVDVNLVGGFLVARAAVRAFLEQGPGGRIVSIGTLSQYGVVGNASYATSKGGQILFMRSMALELAPDKIRVNCVAPAWTDTDMARPSFDAIGRDKLIANAPLGRIGQPTDIAGATVYLLSDLAQYVTGMTLTVDGGQDMRG